MDQQLESLNLEDGSIGIEFDGGEQEVVTSECSFACNSEEVEMGHEIELGQVREEIAMDTDNVQYIHTEQTTNNDMPILDDTVLAEPAPQIHITMEASPILAQTVVEAKKVSPPVVSTPKASRMTTVSQAYRIGGSSLKPISIAPKPITMSGSGFVNMRKYSIAGVQPRAIGDIGGRQVVVVPTSGNRFKMVGTPLRAQTPVQIQVRQRTVPPLTKLAIPAGKDTTGIVAVQKASPARFISIPSQQVGLLGGKITQLVAVSPAKQGIATSTPTVRPIRQSFNTVKSPAKILPAPQGVSGGNKVILTTASQSIVVRPSVSKSGQVMKVDGSTILASIPAGQKINPQQIHQINIPGKGIQYVRLVPAPGLGTQSSATSTPIQAQSQLITTTATTTSQTQTLTIGASKLKPAPPQLLPKTFLITDFKNNVVQVVPSKGKSIINASVPSVSSSIKKIFTKPAKIVTETSTSQIVLETQQNLKMPANAEKSSGDKIVKSGAVVIYNEKCVKEQQVVSDIDEGQEVSDELDSSNTLSEAQHHEVIVNSEVSDENDLNEMVEQSSEEMIQDESLSAPDPLNVVMVPGSYLQMQDPSHQNLQRTQDNDVKEEFSEYPSKIDSAVEFGMRPRKPCNCTKSQCLKLYCDCFANGEFCNQCNCNNCYNNLDNEEYRQKAIRSCLERNPNAFRPKIGKAKSNVGLDVVRRHNKGCNCKRSGCLKNYCECYEGKIACSANCKCVGCRNVEDAIDKKILRRSRVESVIGLNNESFSHNNSHLGLSSTGGKSHKQETLPTTIKSPCNIMTNDVIEAVCQCLIAQAADAESAGMGNPGPPGGARKILEEFAHCLQDIISVAQQHKSGASLI